MLRAFSRRHAHRRLASAVWHPDIRRDLACVLRHRRDAGATGTSSRPERSVAFSPVVRTGRSSRAPQSPSSWIACRTAGFAAESAALTEERARCEAHVRAIDGRLRDISARFLRLPRWGCRFAPRRHQERTQQPRSTPLNPRAAFSNGYCTKTPPTVNSFFSHKGSYLARSWGGTRPDPVDPGQRETSNRHGMSG
jgi:hypothetical protein